MREASHWPVTPPRCTTRRPAGGRSARYGLLVVVSALVLFPVYTTVVAALKPGNKVLENPLIPDAFTLDVLREAWTDGHFGRYMVNSIIVALIITVGVVVTSVLSGYAFVFLKFPGRTSSSWCFSPPCSSVGGDVLGQPAHDRLMAG